MRGFALLRSHPGRSWLAFLGRFERRVARMNFHAIEAEDFLGNLSFDSKLVAHPRFFEQLRNQGQQRAKDWLARHRTQVGKKSSIDLSKLFC